MNIYGIPADAREKAAPLKNQRIQPAAVPSVPQIYFLGIVTDPGASALPALKTAAKIRQHSARPALHFMHKRFFIVFSRIKCLRYPAGRAIMV